MSNKADAKVCDGCGVVEGGKGFYEVLAPFRGHTICAGCQGRWLRREALGREITLDEYKQRREPVK